MATRLNEAAPPAPPARPATAAPAVRDRTYGLGRVETSLPALRLVQPARWPRRVGQLLLLLFVVTPIALAFVPWRQSVEGMGRVVGASPLDREFTVEAPIYGRVSKWMVTESSIVRGPHAVPVGPPFPGDLLAILSNNDPEYLENLEQGLEQIREKEKNAEQQAETYEDIGTTLIDVREQMIEAETNGVEVAKQKAQATRNERRIAEVDRQTSLAQLERYKQLEPKGLVSTRDLELAQQKFSADDQKYMKSGLDLQAADLEVKAKQAKLEEVRQKTRADLSKVAADVQTARTKIAEYRKEELDAESKIRNQQTQYVRAPRDGVIKRLLVNEGVQQLKDGEPLALLVPQTPNLAVELYLDGNDLPLVREGDPVQLQFEGFPAFQISGWFSVAVGTYPGKVALIDPGDSGKGKFRVLVVPDPPDAWPMSRFQGQQESRSALRQGLQAKGWVLLRQVPLGVEFWRRLNGFPPFMAPEESAAGKGGSKGYGDASRADPGPVEAKEKLKAKRPK